MSGISGIMKTWTTPGIRSICCFGLSACARFFALDQTPYANGWDGYFYINQVRSFLEEGRMDVPDTSLVYPFMMLVYLFADNYVLSYKLVACILAGLFTTSLFLLAMKWSGNSQAALIVACVSIFSPHLTWFAAQYPKNLLGMVCYLLLLYWIDSKHKLLILALLILNYFGHRATAALSFASVIAYAFLQKLTTFIPYVLGLFLLVFLIAGFLLPGILNLFDAERLQGIFSAELQFAPYSFINTFGTALISPWWLAELILATLLFIGAAGYVGVGAWRRRNVVPMIIIVLILALLIFPFFEWSMEGPAFRFFLIFVLLCPLLSAFLIGPMGQAKAWIICISLIACSLISYKSYNPRKHDPPYRLYHRVSDGITSRMSEQDCELIIAHKSLAEYIVYSTGIDAMSWLPEYHIEKEKLWRIAEGVKDIQFEYYLEPDDLKFITRLTSAYAMIREDKWNKFLENVRRDGDAEFMRALTGWKNPASMRPHFLLKNKRPADCHIR